MAMMIMMKIMMKKRRKSHNNIDKRKYKMNRKGETLSVLI